MPDESKGCAKGQCRILGLIDLPRFDAMLSHTIQPTASAHSRSEQGCGLVAYQFDAAIKETARKFGVQVYPFIPRSEVNIGF